MKVITVISSFAISSIVLSSGCAMNDRYQDSLSYTTRYSGEARSKNSDLGTIDMVHLVRSNTQASAVAPSGTDGNQSEHRENSEKIAVPSTSDLYEIHVRMNNGNSATIVQERIAGLRVGNRVRIVDGQVYLY